MIPAHGKQKEGKKHGVTRMGLQTPLMMRDKPYSKQETQITRLSQLGQKDSLEKDLEAKKGEV